MGLLKEFIDSEIIMIKEGTKLMLVFFFLLLVIGLPLAYVSHALNVDPKIAGILIGIMITIIVMVIDHKKLHCWKKINDSRYKLLMKYD